MSSQRQVYPDGDKLYLFEYQPISDDLIKLGAGLPGSIIPVGFSVSFRKLENGKIFIDDFEPMIFDSIEGAIEVIQNDFGGYRDRFRKFADKKQKDHDEACNFIRENYHGVLGTAATINVHCDKTLQYNFIIKVHEIENWCTLSVNGVDIDTPINLMIGSPESFYVEAKGVTPDSDFVDFFTHLPSIMIQKISFDKRINPIVIG